MAPQRVYVQPLTVRSDVATLKSLLTAHFSTSGIPVPPSSLQIKKKTAKDSTNNSSYYAIVTVPDATLCIKCLNNTQFDGAVLVIKREQSAEQKAKKDSNYGGKPKPVFGGGWAKPTTAPAPKPKTKAKAKPQPKQVAASPAAAPADANAAFATAVATAAAVTDVPPPAPIDSDSIASFNTLLTGSLDDLLADYGEFTPLPPPDEYAKKSDSATDTVDEGDEDADGSSEEEGEATMGMLAPNGKAPLHVQFVSFGFCYGKPPQNGWSLSDPLPPFDVRSLDKPGDGVIKLSGLSYRVKNELLRNRKSKEGIQTPMWENVHVIAEQAFGAVFDAIRDGASWASPLTISVNVGSEYGRHRSVVLCEAAGIALRNLLRKNEVENKTVSVPCSVGTQHRDVDKKLGMEAHMGRRKRADS